MISKRLIKRAGSLLNAGVYLYLRSRAVGGVVRVTLLEISDVFDILPDDALKSLIELRTKKLIKFYTKKITPKKEIKVFTLYLKGNSSGCKKHKTVIAKGNVGAGKFINIESGKITYEILPTLEKL